MSVAGAMPPEGRFGDTDLSRDQFLGGKVTALQPINGFRSSTDAVFLAASIPARSGQTVLELGAGAGVVSLCLAARVSGLSGVAVELQPAYADLAERNFKANGVDLAVQAGDVAALPDPVRTQRFDHVYFNPPYYRSDSRSIARDAGRETGLGEKVPLARWIDAATRRLAPGGHMTLIQNADRLADILSAFDHRIGCVKILPLASRTGRAANRVVVQARAGRKDPLTLLPPLIVHGSDRHLRDGVDFSTMASRVLVDGEATCLGMQP